MACEVVSGMATVAAPVEVAEVVWVRRDEIAQYVPHGLFRLVEQYLNEVLACGATD